MISACSSIRPRGAGDINFWLSIAIYVVSTLAYIGLCVFLVPSFPWIFFAIYGFIYTPVVSYITARMEGIAGQFISLPLVREASFIAGAKYFGYQGIEIWYAPIPITQLRRGDGAVPADRIDGNEPARHHQGRDRGLSPWS